MDSSPTVHRATAFLHCSSIRSLLAALACCRDLFGVASVGTGSDVDSFLVGVAIGNSSGEEGGLIEGREYILKRLFWESLSWDCDLAIVDIW